MAISAGGSANEHDAPTIGSACGGGAIVAAIGVCGGMRRSRRRSGSGWAVFRLGLGAGSLTLCVVVGGEELTGNEGGSGVLCERVASCREPWCREHHNGVPCFALYPDWSDAAVFPIRANFRKGARPFAGGSSQLPSYSITIGAGCLGFKVCLN